MSKSNGKLYSGRLVNDEHKAVELLDRFTKEFCIDATADDLVFRCDECPFYLKNGNCLVKEFKNKFDTNYKDFGSMGDL